MALFLEPHECEAVSAAWRVHESPLRHGVALASCLQDGTPSG